MERKRNILILIHAHLIENGYIEAAERLSSEGGAVMGKFEVADNIDMSLIMSDYEAYYEMRFDRKPKLVRKLRDGEEKENKGSGSRSRLRRGMHSVLSAEERLRRYGRRQRSGVRAKNLFSQRWAHLPKPHPSLG